MDHEFDGWEPVAAWGRCLEIAGHAEVLGYESTWVYDHFHTDPVPTENITFESFAMLAALAVATKRVRLGHLVLGIGYRNPALVAKIAGTLDVISGGRFELGVGAGWKEDEYRGYGYRFPATRERLEILAESLDVITPMLRDGHGSFDGRHVHADGAVNMPRSVQQPHLPIVIGGNGPNVTWRLAARFADELNLDGLSPDEVRAALPVVRSRCYEVGREPASLRISVHLWGAVAGGESSERIARLAAYRELGVDRVIVQLHSSVASLEVLDRLKHDAVEAGGVFS
jgi:F420-dependent oxidoreductase-like protein